MDECVISNCGSIYWSVVTRAGLKIESDIVNLTGYYGIKTIEKWKFETWNEPDLRGYNRLNFTDNGEFVT